MHISFEAKLTKALWPLITVVGFVLKKDAYAENNPILTFKLGGGSLSWGYFASTGPGPCSGQLQSDVILQYYTTLNPEPPHTHLFGLPICDICHSHKAVYGM